MSSTTVENKSLRFVMKTVAVIRRIAGATASGFRRAIWLAQEFNRIRKLKPRPVKRRTKKQAAKRN
jgi:hypothetical protein